MAVDELSKDSNEFELPKVEAGKDVVLPDVDPEGDCKLSESVLCSELIIAEVITGIVIDPEGITELD